MDAKLYFGKVHIVEWLRPGDRPTGAELLDELEPLGIVSKPQVLTQLHRIATRADFLGVLREIEDDFRATARLPVLHIETHGDYDGIGLSDAEGFTFNELMEELIPLNTLTGLRLIVVMSACLGMWAVKMLQPVNRAACLAVIGPNRKLDDHELARGLQTFYRTMFQVGNVTPQRARSSAATRHLQPLDVGHGREHQGGSSPSLPENQDRRYARYCDLTTPMVLPKQIRTRPLHRLMWIGVLVILVVIALVNGCGV
jgi:hypothetical protein